MNAYIYQVKKAESPPNGFALQSLISGIASVVSSPEGRIPPEDEAAVDSLLGLDWLRSHYEKGNGISLIWTQGKDFIADHPEWEALNNSMIASAGAHNCFSFFAGPLPSGISAPGDAICCCFPHLMLSVLSIAISAITNEARYMLPSLAMFVPLLGMILATSALAQCGLNLNRSLNSIM